MRPPDARERFFAPSRQCVEFGCEGTLIDACLTCRERLGAHCDGVSFLDLRVEFEPRHTGVVLASLAVFMDRIRKDLEPQMDGGHLSVVVFDEEGDCVLD